MKQMHIGATKENKSNNKKGRTYKEFKAKVWFLQFLDSSLEKWHQLSEDNIGATLLQPLEKNRLRAAQNCKDSISTYLALSGNCIVATEIGSYNIHNQKDDSNQKAK